MTWIHFQIKKNPRSYAAGTNRRSVSPGGCRGLIHAGHKGCSKQEPGSRRRANSRPGHWQGDVTGRDRAQVTWPGPAETPWPSVLAATSSRQQRCAEALMGSAACTCRRGSWRQEWQSQREEDILHEKTHRLCFSVQLLSSKSITLLLARPQSLGQASFRGRPFFPPFWH